MRVERPSRHQDAWSEAITRLPDPGEDTALLRCLMEEMVLARRASERLLSLQRQGRIATVPPITGQEATAVGAIHAADLAHDWIVPCYREQLGFGALGDAFLTQMVAYWRGHPDGGHTPDGVRCFPPQIALAAQIPQGVGLAWGLRLRGEDGVVWVFTGEGATSEGDFYEAINLAGVVEAPIVIVVINNGWAISTPVSRQTAASSFAVKAEAAGIFGTRADGNDVLAVLHAARDARVRAEAGQPVVLELETYRVGPHTNADDPLRYVPADELDSWIARDPIVAFRNRLTELGQWDDDTECMVNEKVEARLEAIIDDALSWDVSPGAMFDHVTARPSIRLARQHDERAARFAPAPEEPPAEGTSWHS